MAQLYSKQQLREIFQSPFNQEAWKAILHNLFRAELIRKQAEKFTAEDDNEEGFYLGAHETSDSYRIGLFYFVIKTGSVAHKKVGLRNLVKQFVNPTWGEFDAAIVVFDDKKEWRLSFVCDIKDVKTTPKRYTFVFGEHDNFYRTAIERFLTIQNSEPSFENIRKAFSVDALSDDFFDTYREYYADFVEFITGKRYVKEGNKWVERELGKPNFQYTTTFDCDDKLVRDYVKKMFGRIVFLYFLQRKGWLNGDRQYMHNLFYDSTAKDNFLDGVLEPLFFEVLNTDKQYRTADANALPGSENIPYLNGGLFARDEIDELDCVFPEDYFKKLFDFLDSYNFTIDENDVDDAEIGIDPEMLGRIFENLLEDNKDKGAFYTPKEIVNYMCRESLIAYLQIGVPERSHELIRNFVENCDASQLNAEQNKYLRKKLQDVKICDPAIGSGAFPMGLVNILSRLYIAMKADTDTSKMKRHIIENNIYGVDIEKGAVDIARLRFWLAMIVEEKEPMPLPNLHFKIMQGNSLLESVNSIDLSDLTKTKAARTIFDSTDTERESLKTALSQYYNTSNHADRDRLFNEIINNVRRQIYAKDPNIDQKSLDPSANDKFFLWHTWFADVFDKGGFDIVIGNPPYISAPAQIANPILAKQREDIIACKKYSSLYQKWDLYIPFIEHGIQLACNDGIITMIVPYPLTNQTYGKKLRELIVSNYELFELCDLNGTKIFENATVSNCIPFIKKSLLKTSVTRISHIDESKTIKKVFNKNADDLVREPKTAIWYVDEEKRNAKKHLGLHVLGDFCYISKGMVLYSEDGLFTNKDLISDSQDNIHCRKYIEAKDIERYEVQRTRYIEYNTERVPDKVSRPTFRELYDCPKLITNCLGELKVTVDFEDHYICQQGLRIAVLWKDIANVDNKSISSSIKKYSTLTRKEMELLSEKIDLRYILGILASKYGRELLFIQRAGDYHIVPEHIRNIPIAEATIDQQERVASIVDKILYLKKQSNTNTFLLEQEIDLIVYHLYELSFDEILIIDPDTSITREEYENYE